MAQAQLDLDVLFDNSESGRALAAVVRKATYMEFDEGNEREIFDRIGLRPYIKALLENPNQTDWNWENKQTIEEWERRNKEVRK